MHNANFHDISKIAKFLKNKMMDTNHLSFFFDSCYTAFSQLPFNFYMLDLNSMKNVI